MYHLYMDESGELGTNLRSSQFFLITLLSTENPKALQKRMKRECARLYGAGWPRDIEIKGQKLWQSPQIPKVPETISSKRAEIASRIIQSLVAGPIRVHYSIARKKRLSPHILQADYGIAFNFLAGTLLVRAYPDHFSGPLTLVVDQRNKETHHKLKFDGYVETRLVTDCEHASELTITHEESHNDLGLCAVDFISWGLFRYYEHNDPAFRNLIRPVVGYRDNWYAGK